MSIQYFYNFCLKKFDNTDLSGDLLTAVRRSFIQNRERIRDKVTGNSEDEPLFYDILIEKEKPMKWTVKNADGKTVQEVMLSDNGKYYIYFYHHQTLFKRLLFSKHHTLLKEEYFDSITGAAAHTLEPRKAQDSLCILYTVKTSAKPTPLFAEPEIGDDVVARRMKEEFTDYTVIASTDEGIVRFLSDEQISAFNSLKEKIEQESAENREESFVGDDTPLLDKIKAKDFNIKRNLSSALDITMAMEFGEQDPSEESPSPVAAEESPQKEPPVPVEAPQPESDTDEPDTDETILVDPSETEQRMPAEPIEEVVQPEQAADTPAEPAEVPAPTEEPAIEEPAEKSVAEPDKRIMADGAIYSYYGELDAQGNRSGYGRTMTDEDRTAYEGHYKNDKRSGYGSYFYKSGALCYTGDWKENVRHGVGVGVSSRDGSIHVGNWKNNKPEGNGVRMTAEGDIRFVCKELADGTTVLMHYMPDDTVVISKYDQHGMKLGDTTVSLKDLPIS